MKTTINLFNEEKETMKTFFQLREEIGTVEEDTDYAIGFSKKSYTAGNKGLAHLKKSGLKVNHGDQGSTPGSKPHKKPDATVNYEIGDEPHRDGASGVTLHTKAAKTHAAAKHFKKADDHYEDEDDE